MNRPDPGLGSWRAWRVLRTLGVLLVASSLAACGREAPSTEEPPSPGTPESPALELVRQHPTPVLTTRSPGAEDIRWGFEGGRVVKVDGTYHLFTSEMVDDPMWVKMRLGHWASEDRVSWTRVETVRESSGEYEGRDPRAALWSPLPVWDDTQDLWNLFYVAYRSEPGDGKRFLSNHHGQIWRAVSQTPGREGISGPWEDVGVVMKPGEDSLAWEGLQGTDSFFAWRVGGEWRAFYGSARSERLPIEHWLVGPATAPELAGPWRREREDNPAPIEPRFIENPIVSPAPGGGWLVVYDNEGEDTVGWSFSEDGVHWEPGRRLVVQPEPGAWAKDVRTAMGLVHEGGDRFTLFYTGFEQDPEWERLLQGRGRETCAVGLVELRLNRS